MIAIASFLFWLRFFEVLAVFDGTGPLVYTIIVMLRDDLGQFLLVSIVMMLGYSCSMQLINVEERHSVRAGMIEVFQIFVKGCVMYMCRTELTGALVLLDLVV